MANGNGSNGGSKALHVIGLEAENIKRLRLVRLRLEQDGSLVIVGGNNAQGKTSLLDAIAMALGGSDAIPPDPLRHGARKGKIKLDLGELVIERTFTSRGTTLTVRAADGTERKSPQTLLDSLCAAATFDPLSFTRERPNKQREILRLLLGLDFGELDADRAKLYAMRTETNRDIKALDARLGAMPPPEPGLPKSELSAADLLAEVEKRQAQRAENEKERALVVELGHEHRGLGEDLAAIDKQIAKLEAELAECRADRESVAKRRDGTAERIEAERTRVEALVDPDTAEVKRQLAELETTNRKVRAAAERMKLEQEAQTLAARAERMTDGIEAIDERKRDMLAAAAFPVPGLGFDDDGVTLNGVPLEQSSGAEKLRVSVAIGAALNPRVKVALVRDGSLLDGESMRLLAELAEAADLQVFVERVGDGDPSAIVIEDGCVRGAGSDELEPSVEATS